MHKAKIHAKIFCQVFQNLPVNAFSIVVFAKQWIILLPKFSFFLRNSNSKKPKNCSRNKGL